MKNLRKLLIAAPFLMASGAMATVAAPGQPNSGIVELPLDESWSWGGADLSAPRVIYLAPDARIKPPQGRPTGTKWTYGTLDGAGEQKLNIALAHTPDGRLFLHGGVNGNWDKEWTKELKLGGGKNFAGDKSNDISTYKFGSVVDMGAPFFWNNRPVSLPRKAAAWLGDSPSELMWSWQGFRRGEIEFEGAKRAIIVGDGNGNGSFSDEGADQLWIDRNGDGKLDAVSEQFAAAPLLKIGEKTYSFYLPPVGPARWKEIDSGFGKARVKFQPAAGGGTDEIAMTLVGQTGEAFAAHSFNEELKVPAGKYQTASLTLGLFDRNKLPWRFSFVRGWGDEKSRLYPLEIPRDGTKEVKPFENLKFSTGAPTNLKLKRGTDYTVRLSLETEQGLQLTNAVKNHQNYNENMARIELRDASGKVLSMATSGFA